MNADIQTIFYVLGIATMVLWLLFLLIIVFAVWSFKRKVNKIKSQVPKKVMDFLEGENELVLPIIGFLFTRLFKKKLQGK